MRTLLYSVYTFSIFAVENMMALLVVLVILALGLGVVVVAVVATAAGFAWVAYFAAVLGLFP